MAEKSPREKMDLEGAAERVLSDRSVQRALGDMRRDIVEIWQTTDVDDAAGRERCFDLIKTVDVFERTLKSYILDGQRAREELEAEEKRRRRREELLKETPATKRPVDFRKPYGVV